MTDPTPLPSVAPHDACVVCFKGDTVTMLAFAGEPEWFGAGLIVLGVPDEQARVTVESGPGPSDHLPDGTPVWATRVCAGCANRSPFASMLGRVGEPVRPIARQEDR